MRERPILFSAPMVRAILAGTKTQTRRVVTAPRGTYVEIDERDGTPTPMVDRAPEHVGGEWSELACPYGAPGDRLWVREAWRTHERPSDLVDGVCYRADDAFLPIANSIDASERWIDAHCSGAFGEAWRSPIFMPRWASRLTLAVASVRVERLQSISEEDARAEGAAWRVALGGDLAGAFSHCETPINYRAHFRELWDRINAKRGHSWASNPWVWAITFQRIDAGVRT